MILSTTKKVIAIYNLSRFFFLFSCFCTVAVAQNSTDLNSYCFDRSVNLRDVHQSLKILLLPKDIVESRNADNCIDIVTSLERGKLFEIYLAKRYNLIKDTLGADRIFEDNAKDNCRLDLRTTKKTRIENTNFKIGEKNVLNKGEMVNHSVSTMEFLLGSGKAGEMGIGEENFKVTCQLVGSQSANLIFSYVDKNKASVNSELQMRKNEWVNVASVLKDLEDKTKTLGIPQTEISQTATKIETVYELQFK